MVQQQFKESTVVIIDTGRRTIRAGRGLHELLPTPTVTLAARVGLRKSDILRWKESSGVMDVEQSPSTLPPKGLRPSNYLVGTKLDEVLANGEDVTVWWPFEDGSVSDWVQAEALWKHVLFTRLQLRRTLNEFPVLLSIPKPLSNPSYQILTQLFFERFNVAAFSVNDRAVMELFATSQTTGIVIDVDDLVTDITCLVEGMVLPNGILSVPVGLTDCLRHLAGILSSNPNLVNTLSPPDAPLTPQDLHATLIRFGEQLLRDGHINPPATGTVTVIANPVAAAGATEDDDPSANLASILVAGKEKALIEANSKKKSAAARGAAEREKEKERAAMDLLDVDFEGKKLTVGKERHRMCEPLLDTELVKMMVRQGFKEETNCMTLAQSVYAATQELDVQYRPVVWEAIQITGKLSPAPTFATALGVQLKNYVARDPAEFGLGPNNGPFETHQPKSVKIVKVPEYFANYRENGDELAAFLGASIVAKLTFNDPSGRFLTKMDYSSKGPASIADFL